MPEVKYRQETGSFSNCNILPPATPHSAGYDLQLRSDGPEVGWGIPPGETIKIDTGIFLTIPTGYEAQVRPRSGLALKHSITVLNSPGTIDSDYQGELGILLINHHPTETYFFSPGDKIAQLVFQQLPSITLTRLEPNSVSEPSTPSIRGSGGFGSTGK